MQCAKCNAKLSKKAKSCPECGAAVVAAPETQVDQRVTTATGNAGVAGVVTGDHTQVGGQRHHGDNVQGDKRVINMNGGHYFEGDIIINEASVPVLHPSISDLRYKFDQNFPLLHYFLTSLGILPKPAEMSEINVYLREFRAHIQNEFRKKTYLPLLARSLPQIGAVAHEIDHDPFFSPIHQVVLEIMGKSTGGDSTSPQIAAASRQSRVVRNILKHLERAKDPLVLLGEPGSGKTMTLQQSAMQLVDRELRWRVFPRIPIYVRLGEFHVDGKVDEKAVWEYVRQSAPPSIQSWIEELKRDRLVIFFDGMDEMSRERYGEHTEALSIFASASDSKTKTLFSCRITDFSPNFLHQQFVILPFNRAQVAEYLRTYIGQYFPLIIDGRSWKLQELSKQIVQGALPIEADNPFVLWLLCLYLLDKKSWPGSRVQMLYYYNECNYKRKSEERLDDEPPFPAMEKAFSEWARFAYLISEHNRGAIPVSVLEASQEVAYVHEMIRVGKRCGVLAESREKHGEYLMRFEHHRFQEFFAALYIHNNRPLINWLDRLDAPRWIETMLNLILMGEADDVVTAFADSVSALTQTCRAEIAEIQRLRDEYAFEQAIHDIRRRFWSIQEGNSDENIQNTRGRFWRFFPSRKKRKSLDESIQDIRVQFNSIRADKLEGGLNRLRKEYKEHKEFKHWMEEKYSRFREESEHRQEQEKSSESAANSDASDETQREEEIKEPPLILTDDHETMLAERVETASRIMHHIGASAPDVHERLMPPFRDAVAVLADYGNPITQVKMMRACQNVPDVDFIEALRKPLNSSVNWVRNQALMLIGGSQASARAIGTDLATEIGYDLGSSIFPKRLPAYWKAAHTSEDAGQGWSLVAGICCYLSYLILLLAAAGMLYWGAWFLGDMTWFGLPNFSSLGYPISVPAFGLVLIMGTIAALKMRPVKLWLIILAGTITLVVLIPVLFALWSGSWFELFAFLSCLLFFGFLVIYGASILIAVPIHFALLTIYLILTRRVRRHGHAFITFIRGAWGSSFEKGTWKDGSSNVIGLWSTLGYILGYVLIWLFGLWIKGGTGYPFFVELLIRSLSFPEPQKALSHPLLLGFWVLLYLLIFLFFFSVALFLIIAMVAVTGAALMYFYKRTGRLKFFSSLLIASPVIGVLIGLIDYSVHNRIVAITMAIVIIGSTIMLITMLVNEFRADIKKGLIVVGCILFIPVVGWVFSIASIPTSIGWIIITIIGILVEFSVLVDARREGRLVKAIGGLLLINLLITGMIWVAAHWSQLGSFVAQVAVIIVLLISVISFLRSLVASLRLGFFGAQRFPPGWFSPEAWKNRVEKADADKQENLLRKTDHQVLSLTPDQFLGILKEIQPLIKQEPALSAYWEKRDRLAEALRQERQG